MHEDMHGHGSGRMSRTAIITLKLCTCMLVWTMIGMIVRDVLQGVHVENTMALDPLEFR